MPRKLPIHTVDDTVIFARQMPAMHRTQFFRDPDGNLIDIHAEL